MAANRTAYLLSHAAAQADRSHRPECDDGSPRTDLPPHFGAPPPRSWALPSPPRCDACAVFCSTARRADDNAASMDGLHYDDEANWLKAQVVLGRICDGS